MTYSYDPSLASEVHLVRFHIGDNREEGCYLQDEEIQYFITNYEWKLAVLYCISYIITQLSQPNFKQDWLEINSTDAREGYEKLLTRKSKELGVSLSSVSATSSISLPYRADSYQEDGDYDGAP